MLVWVSGAAGRLGSAVCRQLRGEGHDVVATDRAAADDVVALDLLDADAVDRSLAEVRPDAVVHCAAIPSPEDVGPSELVQNNVMSAFTVLEAADRHGAGRVVLASSGSIYGSAWSPEPIAPSYVPVDEDSPLAFVDPYALSKDLNERTAEMYARRGMTVVALRLHWILDADELDRSRDRVDDDHAVRNLWGYVEREDAARACVLGLTADVPPARLHRVVVAAADTMSTEPTHELLERWLPDVPRRTTFAGTQGCFDIARARDLLGWEPRFTW